MTPPFRWNERAGRFIDRAGRFVARSVVVGALDGALERSREAIGDLRLALRDGRISLAAWQQGMATELRMGHLAAAATARGGWGQLTVADLRHVEGIVTEQLTFLRRFAGQIASGEQPLNGILLRRAELYALMPRMTQHEMERLESLRLGFDEERNMLAASEHCQGCISETERDWVPIGTLVAIGARDCLSKCRCSISYRNSATDARR